MANTLTSQVYSKDNYSNFHHSKKVQAVLYAKSLPSRNHCFLGLLNNELYNLVTNFLLKPSKPKPFRSATILGRVWFTLYNSSRIPYYKTAVFPEDIILPWQSTHNNSMYLTLWESRRSFLLLFCFKSLHFPSCWTKWSRSQVFWRIRLCYYRGWGWIIHCTLLQIRPYQFGWSLYQASTANFKKLLKKICINKYIKCFLIINCSKK